jgi:YVTN family beta-propeller protein
MNRTSLTFMALAAAMAACGDDGTGATDNPMTSGDPTAAPSTDATTGEPPGTTSTTGDVPTTGTVSTGPDPTTGPDPSTSTGDTTTGDTTTGDPVVVSVGPSKGGSIAVNDAGDTLAVANKATGDITLFSLVDPAAPALRTRFAVGGEPVSVSWHPNNRSLFVVLRADAAVVRVDETHTDLPVVGAKLGVGSEPGMAALSPTGERLYVSSWVDGTVSVVATDTMTVSETLAVGGAPYAVCMTNDGDEDDGDETVYVTDFYARPLAGKLEATDGAREGRVFRIATADHAVAESTLAPFADAGIKATPGTGAYPNQLYSCVVNKEHVYVTAVGASPASFMNGTDFHQNVQGLVYALSLADGAQDDARTVNVNALVDALPMGKRFVAIPHDLAFAPNSDFGYVASLASDSLQRVDWSVSPPTAGAPAVNFLAAGKAPTGVAIAGKTAYTYNEVGRSVSVIDLASQTTVTQDVESAEQPAGDADKDALLGQRFFTTGLARWSANGWVSCAACHPFGTTDNVTWSFPAGPRQTVDTSATFDKTGSKQRILNWTAIFDEVHDFELNTRGVAGGTGAIVSTTMLNADGSANVAARIDIVGPGGVPNPKNAFNHGSARGVALTGATPDEWDVIEAYMKTIRAPRGRTNLAGDAVAGRQVFQDAGCQNCHGGPLWTLSERYYTPLVDTNASLTTLFDAGVTTIGQVRADQLPATDTKTLTVIQTDKNGAPHRHVCVSRKVGTFDEKGPDMRGAAEVRQDAKVAQGTDGYNVPSLLNMSTGAPYFHNGAAETLEQALSDAFKTHLQAGNLVFSPTPQQRADLIAFVQSIDDTTAPIAVPAGQVICPKGFVPKP